MKKEFYLLAMLLLMAFAGHAQFEGEEQEKMCGTPAMDPAVLEQFEDWLRVTVEAQRLKDAQRGGAPILTIPVVVHVVHNGSAIGSGNNLSVARINSQIDALNNYFRRVAGTTGGSTHPLAADSEIEFCLAYLAPDGTQIPERGINRIDAADYGFTSPPYDQSYINGTIRSATVWDPTQYMNIWVVGAIGTGDVAGYTNLPVASGGVVIANPPNSPSSIDGFVAGANFFGTTAGNGETVAVHEIGHWLGLHHIAGPGNAGGSCADDDFCSDTPASSLTNASCNGNNSCGETEIPALVMYGVIANCRDMFTQCQVDRMRAILQNSPQRVELLSSTVCDVPTLAPVGAFSVDSTDGCNGTYQFFDESANLATNWVWIFGDGQTFTEKNPTVTFSAPGTYTLTYIVNNEIGTAVPLSTSITVGFTGSADIGISPNVTIQPGGFTQLTASGGLSYSWVPTTGLNNANVPNPIAQPAATTIYTVTGTSAGGCTGTASVIVWVEGTVSINDLLSESALIHPPFPNPVNETVTFSADLETGGNLSLSLLDITGKRLKSIHQDRVAAGAFKTNWQRQSAIPAGIYLVEWNLDGRKSMQKIILN